MSNQPKIDSYIRELTKNFIKIEMESEFVFEVEQGFAKNTVHRMRVELSRMRDVVKKSRLKLKPFKMIIISITDLPLREGEIISQQRVVLKKTQTSSQKVQEILPQLVADNG